MPTLYLVIPFFNETATLQAAVDRVLAVDTPDGWSQHLILIDDGSEQSSADVGQALAAAHSQITLLKHDVNRGKGAAVRTGYAAIIASAADADLAVIQDADLEYDPAELYKLIEVLQREGADALFGNRWGTPARSLKARVHRLGNRFLTHLSNRATGLRLTDMECCYKLITIPMLKRILPELDEDRFGIEPQLAAVLARHDAHVVESPVSYAPRGFDEGKKIGAKDALEAIKVIRRERKRTKAHTTKKGSA